MEGIMDGIHKLNCFLDSNDFFYSDMHVCRIENT